MFKSKVAVKMKETTVNSRQKILTMAKDYSFKLIFFKAMYFISGILVARGSIFGRYYPFGMSITGAAPGKGMTAALIGAILGYLLSLRLGASIRYISTMVAISAIRWTLSDLTKIKKHALYSPVVVFISALITGFAVNSVEGFDGRDITMMFIEALLAAGAAYFFDRTFKIFANKKSYAFSQQELVCVSISISIVTLSLAGIVIGGVSIGQALAVAMILTGSYCMGVSGGSISGIAAGVVFSMPSFGITYISGAYAFGGMISGFCAQFGKIGVCTAFLFANTLVSFQSGDPARIISGLYESIIGIVIFLALPKSFFNRVQLSSPSFLKESKITGLKSAVIQRLNFAARSLSSVSGFVGIISEKLTKIHSPNIKDVCMKPVYATCTNCGLRGLCWDKEHQNTNKNFENIINLVSSGKNVSHTNFSEDFLKRCNKADILVNVIKNSYKEFLSAQTATKRMSELRKVVSEQFDGMGCLLEDIADQFESYQSFDEEQAFKVQDRLKSLGITPQSVTCKYNSTGRLSVEIESKTKDIDKFGNKTTKEISKICGRTLDKPNISVIDNMCRVQISEKTNFDVDLGISQHVCNNGKFCGDNYSYFKDGDGNFNVIISDGMGTGGKAAVEGAMASELMSDLIKSGISFNCAIKLVNSALLVKSEDESLATIDVMTLNLFNGEARFLKAGSPITFIRKNGKVRKVDISSLPIGILNEVAFSSGYCNLEDGDWILMLSDGATDIDDGWIEEIFGSWKDNDAKKLSQYIVSESVKRRKQSHDDDITAVAVRFFKLNI